MSRLSDLRPRFMTTDAAILPASGRDRMPIHRGSAVHSPRAALNRLDERIAAVQRHIIDEIFAVHIARSFIPQRGIERIAAVGPLLRAVFAVDHFPIAGGLGT